MKKKLSRLLAVLLGVLMLAVCVPAAAFADEVDYRLESATIKVGEVWTMTLPKGNRYDWLLSSEYFHYGHNLPDKEGVLMQGDSIFEGDTITYTYKGVMPGTCTITLTDRSFAKIAEATVTVVEADETPVETPDETPAETPTEDKAVTMPAAADDSKPVYVDTRTTQQKEIDEAKANGTWGIEYTTCQKCGYHNWTRKGNIYVCDTCGNETTTVVGPKGVKGYVGSGAIAPVASKAAPETRYATAQQAQAAADQREAAYAAAVAAFQKQVAAREAAYLAALGK